MTLADASRARYPKVLQCQHFTSGAPPSHDTFRVGKKGRTAMESAFGNWRNAIVGIGLTVAVVGGALAAAFW